MALAPWTPKNERLYFCAPVRQQRFMEVDGNSLHPADVVERAVVRWKRMRYIKEAQLPELLVVRADLAEYPAPLVAAGRGTCGLAHRCPQGGIVHETGDPPGEPLRVARWREKAGDPVLDEGIAAGRVSDRREVR